MLWIPLGFLGFFIFMGMLEMGVIGRFVKYVCGVLEDE